MQCSGIASNAINVIAAIEAFTGAKGPIDLEGGSGVGKLVERRQIWQSIGARRLLYHATISVTGMFPRVALE